MSDNNYEQPILTWFRGQADAYVKANEKRGVCCCGTYRCVTKLVGLWNVLLLIGFIVRCIFAETILSEKLDAAKKAAGKEDLTYDYTTVFAMIETFSFIGALYGVFAFFRWSRDNSEVTRRGLTISNYVGVICNTIACILVYIYFTDSVDKSNEELHSDV